MKIPNQIFGRFVDVIRLCLLLLPGLVAAQQWEVPIRWQGTKSVQVQSEILPLPSPVGHAVFFDENSEQFLIEIGQKLTASESDKEFLVTKIEQEVIPSNLSHNLDVDKLPTSPIVSCTKTNGRGDQQLFFRLRHFM